MKQHVAAVDFIRTLLLACKAMQKRANVEMVNITAIGDTTAGSGGKVTNVLKATLESAGVDGESGGGSNGAEMKISTTSGEYIAIPSDEDVTSSTVEVPEWAFEAVFFDTREGAWFDLNLKTGEHYDDAYPSLAVPLFTECYHMLNSGMMVDVLETLQRKGLLQFPGGIPTRLQLRQQWDYPNGWAPINHMIIEGLRKSNNPTFVPFCWRKNF